jgi:Uma2 family endonuclease
MSTAAALTTVAEFLRLPAPKAGHYELHHGEVILMPPPKWRHTRIQKQLEKLLQVAIGDGGTVIMEMPFQPSPEHEVWQADVALLRVERTKHIGSDEYLQGAPDLVVEVLSPSNTAQEMNDKIAVCLEAGCASFWVVDDKRKQVTVTEGDITKRYGQSATIESEILGGSIRVEDIFRV